MSNISQDKLLEVVDNRYSLVVLAAKRAKQIREHASRLLDTDSSNPLTVALEEIATGKVTYEVADHDEPIVAEMEEPEMLGLPAVPEAEDILPIPEDETDEEVAAEAETDVLADVTDEAEESVEPEAELPSIEDVPESTAAEESSQPED